MAGNELIESKRKELVDLVSRFCTEKLDDEYQALCVKLINKISRKRNVPFLVGQINIWASAVVHCIGQINFLSDKSFEPYASLDDICCFFDTSKSTTSQKAKIIRDMFKLGYWDNDFSTNRMLKQNPFNRFTGINGFIVPKDMI
ncbi:MAG: hypothetical protein A2096_12150 [Spirochaetes bacterium GWF1_41_5]|nr:MAG: hypothetical protein A2096_12150 [Spirochaetes bacterium GWF1_41_5]HBE03742.1 hypothetical protein [Spirochaetia bacterium]